MHLQLEICEINPDYKLSWFPFNPCLFWPFSTQMSSDLPPCPSHLSPTLNHQTFPTYTSTPMFLLSSIAPLHVSMCGCEILMFCGFFVVFQVEDSCSCQLLSTRFLWPLSVSVPVWLQAFVIPYFLIKPLHFICLPAGLFGCLLSVHRYSALNMSISLYFTVLLFFYTFLFAI